MHLHLQSAVFTIHLLKGQDEFSAGYAKDFRHGSQNFAVYQRVIGVFGIQWPVMKVTSGFDIASLTGG